VPLDAKNCPACGKFFASVRCPKCGFAGEEGLFKDGCPICGYSATPGGKPAAWSPSPAPRRAGGLPFWVYLVALSSLGAVVGGLLYRLI